MTKRIFETEARAALESLAVSTVYLSGPMTGIPEKNAPLFFAAESELHELGHPCFNPAANQHESWCMAMEQDLSALIECDVMVLLPEWQESQGARIELFVARALELQIIDSYFGLFPYEMIDDVPRSDVEQLVVNQAHRLATVRVAVTTGLFGQ